MLREEVFSPLAHTCAQFASLLHTLLGKGSRHAALLWSDWHRRGALLGDDPAFANASALKAALLTHICPSLPAIVHSTEEGGARKFLLSVGEGLETETVVLPMKSGITLCLSSQVGCKMGCAFCETGRMGLLKDLSAAQIVAQVWHARHTLGLPVRNLVFMGMGEPLDNLDAVLQAIAVLTDPSGLSIAKSRITISTSGRVDGILRLAEELDPAVNLAVSVNAPNDRVRTKLMPVNRRYSMAMLKEAMERYCVHPRREILVEYVLLKGINDSLSDADQLADYLKGLRAKVNLIPYNPQSNMRYQPPSASQADLFAAQLRQRGLYTLMRSTKGQQIMAACGQLGNVQARFTNRNPPGNVAKKTGEGS